MTVLKSFGDHYSYTQESLEVINIYRFNKRGVNVLRKTENENIPRVPEEQYGQKETW